jgi:hypothetical protein
LAEAAVALDDGEDEEEDEEFFYKHKTYNFIDISIKEN